MGILSWIVFGLIAGAIAKLIYRGDDPGGWILTIVLGIVGAFVGGAGDPSARTLPQQAVARLYKYQL